MKSLPASEQREMSRPLGELAGQGCSFSHMEIQGETPLYVAQCANAATLSLSEKTCFARRNSPNGAQMNRDIDFNANPRFSKAIEEANNIPGLSKGAKHHQIHKTILAILAAIPGPVRANV